MQIAYDQAEHEAVQRVLRQKLGPGFISQRNGAGGQRVCKSLFSLVHV